MRLHQRGPDVTFEASNVYQLLRRTAERQPDAEFLIVPDTEARFSVEETHRLVREGAARLRALGVGRGDWVAVVHYNSELLVFLILAAVSLGAVVVPINPDFSENEIGYILGDSAAKLALFTPLLHEKIARAGAGHPVRLLSVATIADLGDAKALDPDELADVAKPHDSAVVLYTSGTTGKPKGVVLDQLNFIADATAIARWFEFTTTTRTLCVLPLFHNNGIVVTMLAPLVAGGSTVITDPKLSLRSFWALASSYGANWTSVMPSILATVLAHCRKPEVQPLVGVICAGQRLAPELQAEFERELGVPVFEGFGLTETTSFACINDYPAARRRAGTVGRALPINDMEVFDEDGKPVPVGYEGEICIRGPNVCVEYHRRGELNAERFRGGWFHSGDYGHRDADGYFHFGGRRDDLIVKGGEKIYPAEVENVLFAHDDVAEVAVIGIPDALLGEELCAFVKLVDGGAASEEQLIAFCRDRIARFKQPGRVVILDRLPDLPEIPKGPTKKVLYRELRAYYRAKLST